MKTTQGQNRGKMEGEEGSCISKVISERKGERQRTSQPPNVRKRGSQKNRCFQGGHKKDAEIKCRPEIFVLK